MASIFKKIGRSIAKSFGLVPEISIWDDNKIIPDDTVGPEEKQVTVDVLYDIIKKSPELVAVIQALIEDILYAGFEYIGPKRNIAKAEEFEQNSNYYKILSDALWDLFLTGDAWILKIFPEKYKIEEKARKLVDMYGVTFEKDYVKDIFVNQIVSKVSSKVSNKIYGLQLLKASTVKPEYNKNGVLKRVVQVVGDKKVVFQPDEVIHLSITNLGGGVKGFSPLHSLLSDIATLIYAKDTAGAIFENNGLSPVIYNLPDVASTEDEAYLQLKNQLQELRKSKNKYKNLLTIGNLKIMKAENAIKDIEFRELITHFTELIMMAWGVPPTRVKPAGDTRRPSRELHENYYNRISYLQNILEPQLNNQLWLKHFKVRQKFKRPYLIDEIREAQVIAVLFDRGLITVEEARNKIGLPIEPNGALPEKKKPDENSYTSENADRKRTSGNALSDATDETIPPELRDNKVKR